MRVSAFCAPQLFLSLTFLSFGPCAPVQKGLFAMAACQGLLPASTGRIIRRAEK